MRRLGAAVYRSASEVLFLPAGRLGLLVLAIALVQPAAGLTGLTAVSASWALASLLRLDRKAVEQGFYWYNPLLVGLSVGFFAQLSPATMLLAAIAGGLTLLVCIASAHLLKEFFGLPVLSLPFVIVSSLVYLACARYPVVGPPPAHVLLLLPTGPALPAMVTGYFDAFGNIFFAPNFWAGLVLAVIVLCYSRILFLLSILGYGVGVAVRAFLTGSLAVALVDANAFNFILVSMALGGVFLVPSGRSYLIASIGTVAAAIVLDAWIAAGAGHGLPPVAAPFNIVVLAVVYCLRLTEFNGLALAPGRTPEETLELDVVNRLRYRGALRAVHLPFSGAWTVWQAFDGRWTHQGPWRFAYDFVITDDQGKTHQGSGRELEDYYCFRKPVLSPVAGRVVRVVKHLPDQPIGQTDGSENWGNAVVIRDHRGFFIEISHFAADSIRVAEGEEVVRGAILGLCGNSGYSPQPHIHIQVQTTDQIGAATLPFSFAGYIVDGEFFANDRPKERAILEAAWPNQHLEAATACYLDQEIEYEVLRGTRLAGHLSLRVRMASDGTFYFESADGSRLYFGIQSGTFYAYRFVGNDPWLRTIFVALPRLPLSQKEGLRWNDCLPAGVLYAGWKRLAIELLCTFVPSRAAVSTEHCFVRRDAVETRIDARFGNYPDPILVLLGSDVPVARLSIGDVELRQVTAPLEIAVGSEMPVNEELQPALHFNCPFDAQSTRPERIASLMPFRPCGPPA